MEGLERIRELAERDRQFVAKLEEARRSADDRIADAQDKARQILDEADTRIRTMTEASKTQIAEACNTIAEEARVRAEAEAEGIRRQADPHIDRAVRFLLSEVLP